LSSTAQLGYAKIALALLLRVIFFKNHSRRVYFPTEKVSRYDLSPENSFLNSPFGPEKSPFTALSRRSFMKNAG